MSIITKEAITRAYDQAINEAPSFFELYEGGNKALTLEFADQLKKGNRYGSKTQKLQTGHTAVISGEGFKHTITNTSKEHLGFLKDKMLKSFTKLNTFKVSPIKKPSNGEAFAMAMDYAKQTASAHKAFRKNDNAANLAELNDCLTLCAEIVRNNEFEDKIEELLAIIPEELHSSFYQIAECKQPEFVAIEELGQQAQQTAPELTELEELKQAQQQRAPVKLHYSELPFFDAVSQLAIGLTVMIGNFKTERSNYSSGMTEKLVIDTYTVAQILKNSVELKMVSSYGWGENKTTTTFKRFTLIQLLTSNLCIKQGDEYYFSGEKKYFDVMNERFISYNRHLTEQIALLEDQSKPIEPIEPAKPADCSPIEPANQNIGREWRSIWGTQKIISYEAGNSEYGIKGLYDVQTVDNGTIRRYQEDRIEEVIKSDEYKLTTEYAQNQATKAELSQQAKALEQKQKEQQEQNNQAKNSALHGFLTGLSELQKEQYTKALDKLVSIKDNIKPLYEHILLMALSGLSVDYYEEFKIKDMSRTAYNRATNEQQAAHEKKQKEAGKKTVYLVNNYDLGKIAYDFACHLIEKNQTEIDKPADYATSCAEAELAKPAEQPQPEDFLTSAFNYLILIGAIDKSADRTQEYFDFLPEFAEKNLFYRIRITDNPNYSRFLLFTTKLGKHLHINTIDELKTELQKIALAREKFKTITDYIETLPVNNPHKTEKTFNSYLDFPIAEKRLTVLIDSYTYEVSAELGGEPFNSIAELKAMIALLKNALPFHHADSADSHKQAVKDAVYAKIQATPQFSELKALIDGSILRKLGKTKGGELIASYGIEDYLSWNYTTRGIIKSVSKWRKMNVLAWDMYNLNNITVDLGHNIDWFAERVKHFQQTQTAKPAEHSIKTTPASHLSLIMTNAWLIAHTAAAKFGGNSKDYFNQALKLAWTEYKATQTNATKPATTTHSTIKTTTPTGRHARQQRAATLNQRRKLHRRPTNYDRAMQNYHRT